MSGDDFRPREHDHLVEPMFGGLGVEGRSRSDAPRPSVFRRFWQRLWRGLVRLVRLSRPASGE